MKILKKLGIFLGVLIVLILIVSAFLPGTVVVSRTRTMPISRATAFEKINTLQEWRKWMTWAKLDTAAAYTYSGEPAVGKGAWYSWKGNKDMGEGKMTITDVYGLDSLKMDLVFADYPPNPVVFKLFEKEKGTEVYWAMTMKMPFYMRIMGLFMDGMMGKDFEGGLEGIENLGLKEPAKEASKMEFTIEETKPMMCLCVMDSCEMGPMVVERFGKGLGIVQAEMKTQKVEMAGAPFCTIIRHDKDKNFLVFSPGLPVTAEVKSVKNKNVKYMNCPAQKAVVYNYYGDYLKMEPAYEAMKKYIADNSMEKAGPSWEEYITDPMNEKDTAKWLTKIYIPVK
jgi:effector-binding domain-containing protein